VKEAYITHRSRKQFFEIPSEWNILTFADFPDRLRTNDVEELTEKALRNPIKSPSLQEVLSHHDSVAIIVEDITRVSPKKRILEVLLQNLDEIDIPDQNISIIIALGTHRKLTLSELETMFGKELLSRYAFTNHDCRALDLKPVGRLRSGQEVKINRKVYEATFKIAIGSIVPHGMNGFGGGGKIVFPGVSDFNSIRAL